MRGGCELPCKPLFDETIGSAGECEGESKSGGSCEGYEPIMNSKGKDVVIGTAVFEGYLAGEGILMHTPEALLASNAPARDSSFPCTE